MKYRIKQVGDKFYPQYKKSFKWIHYMNNGAPSSFLSGEINTEYYMCLYFISLEEASEFISVEKKKDTVIYHNF